MEKSISYDAMRVANLEPASKRKFFALANRKRGAALELLARVIFRIDYGINDFEKRAAFRTPHGVRFVDLYSPSNKLSIEVKAGRACSKKFTRKQIEKDNYILENSQLVSKSIWICFQGATASLQSIINKTNIKYISFENIDLDPCNQNIKKLIE